jgi:hypothetical protein
LTENLGRFTKSIELYAKKTHHFSPILVNWLHNFFCKILLNNDSSNRSEFIPLSPQTEVKMLIYRGDIGIKSSDNNIKKISRRGKNKISISDSEALRVLSKIPEKRRIRVKLNLKSFLKSVNWAWILITPWKCLPSGRAAPTPDENQDCPQLKNNSKKLKNKVKKTQSTPCFMFLNLQVWGSGILNFPGYHCGNCFDLAIPKGMALILHEIYHIYQFRRNPFKLIWSYVKAIHDSLVIDKIPFAHPRIPFEIEAIAFENEIMRYLQMPKWRKSLEKFKKYR